MNEQQAEAPQAETNEAGQEDKRDLSWHLDRIWDEIKQITRQVEKETRRGGKIARLRFDIRGLRRERAEQTSILGRLIYDAQMAAGKRPTLSRVDGYDDVIAKIAEIDGGIEAKETLITELKAQGEEEPEDVAVG